MTKKQCKQLQVGDRFRIPPVGEYVVTLVETYRGNAIAFTVTREGREHRISFPHWHAHHFDAVMELAELL